LSTFKGSTKPFDVLKVIINENGVAGLYTGLSAALLR